MATLTGGTASETINGTSGADVIYANGGNDTVYAGGGADLVYGGNGNDYIDGGNGVDTIYGGAGNDALMGREGRDVFAFNFKVLGGQTSAEGGTTAPTVYGYGQLYNPTNPNLANGDDTILDFDYRYTREMSDYLRFNGMTADQYDQLVASGQLTVEYGLFTAGDTNKDMKINFDGGSIVLSGIGDWTITGLADLKKYIVFDVQA
ncbi:calcium-binding protein [Prosthecomicrobium sp. N25]|uniref:calcium-binding protein n=1 Tax=Prosthecomicrobium sp. N25 TaxID=3129254 RepID=UPI0030781694